MADTPVARPAADSTAPGAFELLKFSYSEVLDATKHQDDKVGRLLGAVAFLTGGALVFANKDVLQVDVLVGDQAYPLGAVTLAAFLLIDLVAVASFMIAMSAPLTLPRESGPRRSHIYFRTIAGLSKDEWTALWTAEGLEGFEDELRGEIRNIAERADRKYGRTTIATNLFLAALTVLAPTVVLGLAAAGRGTPLPWDAPLRWSVAISVWAASFALLVPLAFTARDPRTIGRPAPLWCVVVTYPLALASMVVANPSASFFGGGGWAIAAFGIATVLLMVWVYAGSTVRFILHASAIGLLTAGGLVAWSIDRPDVQLFVAIGGCILIVVPNIVDELRHRSDDGEIAG
jgi:hypothetical protein